MGIIKVLPTATARLIAAGEVIDRPASALRELLDNAIDSGASEVSVRIEEGGIGLIRVSDDGAGMDAQDVELSILPHATSKISSADDLLRARSLGFRGEALASIAAAARLEILSRDDASPSATRLVAGPGQESRAEPVAGRRGTTVSVSGLFLDFPARRQFLKRPQAEAALCKQVFLDKALAHPGIRFRYESGSGAHEVLMPSDRSGRLADCYPEPPRQLLHSVAFSGAGFEGEAVVAGPAFYRPDRRLMQAFVNRRRVQEWPLLQSLDYAFEGFLPGGAHPCAFLFLEVDPALADFNIHPAKREVRFKDPDGPRRALAQALRAFLVDLARRDPAQVAPGLASEPELYPAGQEGGGARASGAWYGEARAGSVAEGSPWPGIEAMRERATPLPTARDALAFRYLGRALGPFLLFEMGDSLYCLDQHAAHERLLFDRLSSRPIESQELLVPQPLEAESEEEESRIASLESAIALAGFRLVRDEEGLTVAAAPAWLAEDPAGALRDMVRRGASDPLRELRATAACRAAVKDGDELDEVAAVELISAALELPEPRCPHGRPIWAVISREQLYRLVRRIV
jgi:DNA mismatch repair protein MutL